MVMMPGIPSTQNLIPANFLGTDAYAGALLGVICSVVMFALSYVYLQWEIGRCRRRGEHFSPSPGETLARPDGADAPPVWACFAPIVLLVVLVFVLQRAMGMQATDAVTISMLAAVIAACLLYRRRLADVRRAIGESCASGLGSLVSVASIMGFGGVVVPRPPTRASSRRSCPRA